MKIMLDAGHGGSASGAVGRMSFYGNPPEQVLEKNLNLTLATSVYHYLQAMFNAQVFMTRTSDIDVTIDARSAVAHNNMVDAVLSIHFNAFNGTVRGVETFYAATRSSDVRFATSIQDQVVDCFNPVSRGVKNDTQSGPGSLGILRNYPSDPYPRALIEVEFIDNLTAMNEVLGYDFYERTLDFAYAICRGIGLYFNVLSDVSAEDLKNEYKKSDEWKLISAAVEELKKAAE